MTAGKPIDAAKVRKATAVYLRTGSFAEAAAAIGVDRGVIRRRLIQEGLPRRETLFAEAISKGIADGLDLIDQALTDGKRWLSEATSGKDWAVVSSAICRLQDARLHTLETTLRKRQAALTRRRTRAEIKALETGTTPTGDVTVTVNLTPVDSHETTERDLPSS